jgi:hypothetical protein
MVVNCEVKFDNNPNAIYFAGQVMSVGTFYLCDINFKSVFFCLQTLSGVVELTVDKPKKIRGM